MDRRSLPISMRPHICRVTPQSQQMIEPEPLGFLETEPKPEPKTPAKKSKKETIVCHTADSSIREEVITLMRKRNG